MADRTTYHAGQGGTGKNGPAQSGVGGIRGGGGTAGQTDNTGGGRQMNGHYSGQNRKQNYRKGQNRNRLGGGHQRGGMMQQGNIQNLNSKSGVHGPSARTKSVLGYVT